MSIIHVRDICLRQPKYFMCMIRNKLTNMNVYDLRNTTYFQFFSLPNSVGSVPVARLYSVDESTVLVQSRIGLVLGAARD